MKKEITYYWYSSKQKAQFLKLHYAGIIKKDHLCEVKHDGYWKQYTMATQSKEHGSNWNDIDLVCKGNNLKVRVNGILQ